MAEPVDEPLGVVQLDEDAGKRAVGVEVVEVREGDRDLRCAGELGVGVGERDDLFKAPLSARRRAPASSTWTAGSAG